MRAYEQLNVWKVADALVVSIYALTKRLPADERYGLATQLRRAAVSIPSNIAEGSGRDSDADFERFLSIAAGSASEVEYQLSLVERLWPEIEQATTSRRQARRVRRMLWGLLRASRADSPRSEIRRPMSAG